MGFEGLATRKEQMDESGESGPFLDVDDGFKATLIVPLDRDAQAESLLKQNTTMEKRKDKYLEILQGVEIKKAAFSIREVVELTKYIYGRIEQD